MQALGKPQWGEIKEHAPLPVKQYCHTHALTHNGYVYIDSFDLILNRLKVISQPMI